MDNMTICNYILKVSKVAFYSLFCCMQLQNPPHEAPTTACVTLLTQGGVQNCFER